MLLAALVLQLAALTAAHAEKTADCTRAAKNFDKRLKYNPADEIDNCVACTATFLNNAFVRNMEHTAESLEREAGPAGIEQHFDLRHAIEYIQQATDSTASGQPVAFMDARARPGFYAIFFNNGDSYHHVVSAWITRGGRKLVFDAQSGLVTELKTGADWAALLKANGARGARPYQFIPNAE
jgi:hypothetical protein